MIVRDWNARCSFTPTWSTPTWSTRGLSPVIGNGTLEGAYERPVARRSAEWLTVMMTIGATTSFGTGAWELGLPLNKLAHWLEAGAGTAFDHTHHEAWPLVVRRDDEYDYGETTLALFSLRDGRPVTAAVPFVWRPGDELRVVLGAAPEDVGRWT